MMKGLSLRVAALVAALWWGSLSAVGAYVVPLAFTTLGAPKVAGVLAARYFSAQNCLGLVCGAVLLMILNQNRSRAHMESARAAIIFVVFGMLTALLVEFAVGPRIAAASLSGESVRLWHRVGVGLMLMQWLASGWVLWRVVALTQNEAGR